MKCPKCHYLSFEPEPRCRNCGFSFSLAEQQDVLIRDPEPNAGPFADLDLRPNTRADGVTTPPPAPSVTTPAPASARPAPTTELPLFVKALSASEPEVAASRDEPLVNVPADPRPPLSVRRKTADGGRPRPTPTPSEMKKLGPFDRDLLEDLQRMEQGSDQGPARSTSASTSTDRAPGVGPVPRAAAAAIDAALLGATAAGVLWITLRWCDLSFARISVLPIVPTAAFLMLVGAGYLLMFTAFGGQTLGKMALGLRVVNDDAEVVAAVSLKQALYRAVLTLPSVLVFGLGFIPALLGEERAFHDRLAHTRVVRA